MERKILYECDECGHRWLTTYYWNCDACSECSMGDGYILRKEDREYVANVALPELWGENDKESLELAVFLATGSESEK